MQAIEVHVNVDDIIDQIETETLIEEICSRGSVAAEDWAGLFNDDLGLITDILDAIREESATEEVISWLKREGYRVTNADDDVVVIKRSKLESVVYVHIVDALARIDEQVDETREVILSAVSMLTENAKKTARERSERAIKGIIEELK